MKQKEIDEIIPPKIRELIKEETLLLLEHSLLGGAWHCERVLENFALTLDDDIADAVIAQMKIYFVIAIFENYVWCSKDEKKREDLAQGIIKMLTKISKDKQPFIYDRNQKMIPPSVREADLFNRGCNHIIERLKCATVLCPKYRLKETIDEFIKNFDKDIVKPNSCDP